MPAFPVTPVDQSAFVEDSTPFVDACSWPSVLEHADKARASEDDVKPKSFSFSSSPSIQHMHKIGKTRLAADNEEGQALRRKILRGSVIVFIGAGGSSKRFTFETAHRLGVQSIIIDSPDSWSTVLEKEGIVKKFIGIDMIDPDSLFEEILGTIGEAGDEIGGIDAVTTFCEVATPLVARLCEALQLPGNPFKAVDTARDKHAARDFLADAGLPTPGNFLITEPSELKTAADKVGFPAVIKPVSGAASLGVIRVDDFADLEKSYNRVVKEMRQYRVTSGALVAGAEVDDDLDEEGTAAKWVKPRIIMEEYLDGPEVDIDCVMSEGGVYYSKVSDNWPTLEPFFQETGANCPSRLPDDQVEGLRRLAVDSIVAMGFTTGVFHVEAKYTSRGPRLVEINPRMGGGGVHELNQRAWGICMVEEQLMASVGIPCRPQISAEPLAYIAYYLQNACTTGTVKDMSVCDRVAAADETVLYCRPLVKVGDRVVALADGLPTWVAEYMVATPSMDQSVATVEKLIKVLDAEFEITPKS